MTKYEDGPRGLLKAIMDENPKATKEQILKLFKAELRDHPEYSKQIHGEMMQELRVKKLN